MFFTSRFRKTFQHARILFPLLVQSALLMVFSSCQKEKINFTFTQLSSGITNDLNSIYFFNDSVGYACGGSRYEKGDILKTTNSGFTWSDQSTPDMSKALYNITFINQDTGFACGYDGKIFRTYNAGSEWVYFQTALYRPLRDLFMLNSEKGYCCGGDGYKSGCTFNTFDGGDNWSFDTSGVEFRDIIFFNDQVGLECGYGAILRTTDAGAHWTYTNAKQDFFVSMCFVNDEVGYAIGYTGSIMKTVDGGQSWDRLRNSNSLFQPQWFLNEVIFRDENVGYIIGEHGCFLKTQDGGNHWNKVENAPDADWNGIALVKDGGFICGAEGKIYRFLE